ncbi:MAG: hypothetical protein ACE5GM_07745 [bacterium]
MKKLHYWGIVGFIWAAGACSNASNLSVTRKSTTVGGEGYVVTTRELAPKPTPTYREARKVGVSGIILLKDSLTPSEETESKEFEGITDSSYLYRSKNPLRIRRMRLRRFRH